MAYRLLLGREPEDEAAVAFHARSSPDLRALRGRFLDSEEFDASRVSRLAASLDLAPILRIDVDVSEDELQKMLRRVEETWRRLGGSEPFWSVLSSDQFKQDRFAENADRYYESGERDAARLMAWIRRSDPSFQAVQRTCCEYGCGTGRVTRWLASRFSQVTACDISQPHLELAQEYLGRVGVLNVRFHRIESLDSLARIGPIDVVFSCIVLQHNPPPVMAFMLSHMLRWLKPGGFAFFQVPTYCLHYKFVASDYLNAATAHEIEMHVLPQRSVYSIAEQQNCELLEVQPDRCVGLPNWISNSFLFQKRK